MVDLYMASTLRDKASNTWSALDEIVEYCFIRRRQTSELSFHQQINH